MKHRTFSEWLEDFVRYNEDGDVKRRYITPEGYALGTWVSNIRAGNFKLTEEQKRSLTEAGFKWNGKEKAKRTFEEWFDDYVRYNKDGLVPESYITPEGYRLGKWVSNVREGNNKLTDEQKRRLKKAGFRWKGECNKVKRTFDEWFADYVLYNQKGYVEAKYVTPEGYKLGWWVQNIRKGQYKLTEEQRKRLNDAGFVWRIVYR